MSDRTNQSGERDNLTGHEYDGIQEYDNPTPGWWIWLFVASVIFAAFYFVYYHSQQPNRSIYDSYADDTAANLKKKLDALGFKDPTITQDHMLEWMANKDYVDYGRSVFKQNCTSCHGENGEGKVGPNLTDEYFKNIKTLTDVPRVISNGAANGKMPAWQSLGPVDVALVGSYVATMRGKNLPSAITPAAYGDKIDPWPPLPATKPASASAQASAPATAK